jgi:FKBP-type peptidyl-prolyl cis-trans isomerase
MRYVALLMIVTALVLTGCGAKEEAQTERAGISRKKVAEPKAEQPRAEKEPAKEARTPSGWVKLESGLEYKDIKVGAGPVVKSGDMVTVHYKGWLDGGKVFDTSRKPGGQPFEFQVGQGMVIPGWDQGIPGMKVGGKRELKIPAELGYGDMDQGPIPANSTLHFDVEVLKTGS